MNRIEIKRKAKEIVNNQRNLFSAMMIICLVGALISSIPNLFPKPMSGMIAFVLGIITITYSHGNIVCSLKAANGHDDMIVPKEDSMVGFKRFSNLFSTYLIINLILFVIVFVGAFLGVFFLMAFGTGTGTLESGSLSFSTTNPIMVIALVAVMALVIFILVYVSLGMALAPYILEKYNIQGMAAIKESNRLMKGHRMELFSILISFIGWAVLLIVITTLFAMVMSIILIPFIVTVLTTIVGYVLYVYLFGMYLNVTIALYYENRDFNDKNHVVEGEIING
ncbi:MAG: DUF975 family protein [Thomasclavelia sp.]|nr:DUF975 family protein [Thomasclavelia sp.]